MKKRNRFGAIFGIVSVALLLIVLWLVLRGAGAVIKELSGGQSAAIQTLAPVQTPTPPAPPDGADSSAKPTGVQTERYFRRRLSGEYQAIYDMLVQALAQHPEVIEDIKAGDMEALKETYRYVIYDYPEYFWATEGSHWSYTERNGVYTVDLSPTYDISAADYMRCSAEVEAATRDIINALSVVSDYEKVKGVYEYVVNNTVYDDTYQGKTLYELFTEGRAVCEGYARATQYLLTKLGVEAVYVSGWTADSRAEDGGHAWNIVKIAGEYYNVDATWGDPVMDSGQQVLSYQYLCVTDEDMSRTHFIDTDFYPRCTATAYNYYVHEGRLLSSYDEQTLTAWLQQAYIAGKPLQFRTADSELYNTLISQLIDNDGMFSLLSNIPGWNANAYSYTYNEEMNVITVYLDG